MPHCIDIKQLRKRTRQTTESLMDEVGGVADCSSITVNQVKLDRKYAYRNAGNSVLAVAHCDFRDCGSAHFHSDGHHIWSSRLDDRLGVYLILDFLPILGIDCDILLTDHEESSNSTAKDFAESIGNAHPYNWMFQFDRRGDDAVNYCYTDMKKHVEKHFSHGFGSASDISKMEDMEICGMNVGTGYHGEHTLGCYASISEIVSQVNKFFEFFGELRETKIPHKKWQATKSQHWNYSADRVNEVWRNGKWMTIEEENILDAKENKAIWFLGEFLIPSDIVVRAREMVVKHGPTHTYWGGVKMKKDAAAWEIVHFYDKLAELYEKHQKGEETIIDDWPTVSQIETKRAKEEEDRRAAIEERRMLHGSKSTWNKERWAELMEEEEERILAERNLLTMTTNLTKEEMEEMDRDEMDALARDEYAKYGGKRNIKLKDFRERYATGLDKYDALALWNMFCTSLHAIRKAAKRAMYETRNALQKQADEIIANGETKSLDDIIDDNSQTILIPERVRQELLTAEEESQVEEIFSTWRKEDIEATTSNLG